MTIMVAGFCETVPELLVVLRLKSLSVCDVIFGFNVFLLLFLVRVDNADNDDFLKIF